MVAAPAAAPEAAPAAAPQPETAVKPADEPVMVPINGDADAQVKAAEAAKVAEIKARQAAEQQAADEAAAKKAAEQMAAKVAETPKPAAASVPTQMGDNPAQAKAREALANSLFNMSADTPVTPVTPVTTTPAAKPGVVVTPMPEPGQPMKMVIAPAPIGMAPPLPISAEKQQKLQALLAKYRMDQVTPEEYQTQRAAILAEP